MRQRKSLELYPLTMCYFIIRTQKCTKLFFNHYIVEEIKRNSSRWIKNLDPAYYHFFAWQGGYAAYSISQSVVDKTLQYIANQKEHHTKHSFAEEYRAFLQLYNVEYDENFVFRD